MTSPTTGTLSIADGAFSFFTTQEDIMVGDVVIKRPPPMFMTLVLQTEERVSDAQFFDLAYGHDYNVNPGSKLIRANDNFIACRTCWVRRRNTVDIMAESTRVSGHNEHKYLEDSCK